MRRRTTRLKALYMNKTVYKILTTDQWSALQAQGVSEGAPIDVEDGFVHFSNAEQLQETADKHFKDQSGLFLIAMDSQALGDQLRWEPSRGGDLFPHLYAELRLDKVLWVKPLPLEEGRHQLPDL